MPFLLLESQDLKYNYLNQNHLSQVKGVVVVVVETVVMTVVVCGDGVSGRSRMSNGSTYFQPR